MGPGLRPEKPPPTQLRGQERRTVPAGAAGSGPCPSYTAGVRGRGQAASRLRLSAVHGPSVAAPPEAVPGPSGRCPVQGLVAEAGLWGSGADGEGIGVRVHACTCKPVPCVSTALSLLPTRPCSAPLCAHHVSQPRAPGRPGPTLWAWPCAGLAHGEADPAQRGPLACGGGGKPIFSGPSTTQTWVTWAGH